MSLNIVGFDLKNCSGTDQFATNIVKNPNDTQPYKLKWDFKKKGMLPSVMKSTVVLGNKVNEVKIKKVYI